MTLSRLYMDKKKISLSLALFASALFTTLTLASLQEYDVSDLIYSLQSGDKRKVAQHMQFPLRRPAPLMPIENEEQLVSRFYEVFDSNLVNKIVNSDMDVDWQHVGSRGVMFENGSVWLSGNSGKIIAVNYQTPVTKLMVNEANKLQMWALDTSISDFTYNVLDVRTENHRIRIDSLPGSKLRYASWPADAKYFDKPELIIVDGRKVFDGSGGNHKYLFSNGRYTYEMAVNVIGKTNVNYLRVYNGEVLISEQGTVEDLNH
ncbi:hypothetical protein AB6D22_03565 [Vibrio splendidus]